MPPNDLVRGKGITPYQRVYREVVAEVLDAEAEITEERSFQVLIGFPVLGWSRLAGLLPAIIYEL